MKKCNSAVKEANTAAYFVAHLNEDPAKAMIRAEATAKAAAEQAKKS